MSHSDVSHHALTQRIFFYAKWTPGYKPRRRPVVSKDGTMAKCAYCGDSLVRGKKAHDAGNNKAKTKDHRIPRSLRHDPYWRKFYLNKGNKVQCCLQCNQEKGGHLFDDEFQQVVIFRQTYMWRTDERNFAP